MTEQQLNEMSIWLEENKKLFPPYNSRPTASQQTQVFYWANMLNPKAGHKPSGCGRCYYNARAEIIKLSNLF